MVIRNKIQEILDELRNEGKLTVLPDDKWQQIQAHIHGGMKAFRHELRRRQVQSEDDTKKIIVV